jgi:hypothetical protein
VRWMAAGVMTLALCACASEEPLPSPKTAPVPALFEPAQICVELPPPPPEHISQGADARGCVPSRYAKGLPLEITITRGRVTAFRFYEQCEGRVHEIEPSVRECIRAAVETWRFDYVPPQCPGPSGGQYDEFTMQLYIMPRGQPVPRQQAASGVGFGCPAG